MKITALCLSSTLIVLQPSASLAQFPQSVICQFEKIATAELDASNRIAVNGENSMGEIVISNLNSETPIGSGNVGAVRFQVLRKSKDAISLIAPVNSALLMNEFVSVVTLFFKTGIVMHTKHEILNTVRGDQPFGFVEIGKCRPLK